MSVVVDGKTRLAEAGPPADTPVDGSRVTGTVTVKEFETVTEIKAVTVGAGACCVLGSRAV